MLFNGNAIDDQNRKLARERSRWKKWKNSRQCTNFFCVFYYSDHYDIVNHCHHCDYCKPIELSNVQLFTLLSYSTLEPNVLFVTVIVS